MSGSNQPPRPIVPPLPALLDYLEAWLADDDERATEIIRVLSTTPPTLTDAAQAAIVSDNAQIASALLATWERKHKEVKEPYLHGGRAIDTTFRTRVDRLRAALAPVSACIASYLDAKDKEAKAAAEIEARLLREAAEKAAAEAAGALERQSAEVAEAVAAAASKAAAEAAEAEQRAAGSPADRDVKIRGAQGSVSSLRVSWEIEITDMAQLPFAYHLPDLMKLRAEVRAAARRPDGEPEWSKPGARLVRKVTRTGRG